MNRLLAFFSAAPLLLVAACSGAPDTGSDSTESDIKAKVCGGVAGIECASGYSCDFGTGPSHPDQTGTCKKTPAVHACGGIAGLSCPSGYSCSMPEGAAPDQTGSCVKAAAPQTCGGIAGIRCPSGQVCELSDPNVPDQSGTCVSK